jgi:hypothetical protein
MSHENVEVVRRGFEHFMATGEPLWEVRCVEIGRARLAQPRHERIGPISHQRQVRVVHAEAAARPSAGRQHKVDVSVGSLGYGLRHWGET